MESIYTKLALYGSKNECATTDNVFFPHILGMRWYGFPLALWGYGSPCLLYNLALGGYGSPCLLNNLALGVMVVHAFFIIEPEGAMVVLAFFKI